MELRHIVVHLRGALREALLGDYATHSWLLARLVRAQEVAINERPRERNRDFFIRLHAMVRPTTINQTGPARPRSHTSLPSNNALSRLARYSLDRGQR